MKIASQTVRMSRALQATGMCTDCKEILGHALREHSFFLEALIWTAAQNYYWPYVVGCS